MHSEHTWNGRNVHSQRDNSSISCNSFNHRISIQIRACKCTLCSFRVFLIRYEYQTSIVPVIMKPQRTLNKKLHLYQCNYVSYRTQLLCFIFIVYYIHYHCSGTYSDRYPSSSHTTDWSTETPVPLI